MRDAARPRCIFRPAVARRAESRRFRELARSFRHAALALVVAAWLPATVAASDPPAANPQRQLLAALTELLQKNPRHVGAIYVAARTAAALGDEATAIVWLDRLEEVGMDDELDPDDFGTFAHTPAYRERAARFAARAKPIGKAARVTELRCAGLLPEGTAWDPKRRELLLSSGRRRTVVAVAADGSCRDVLPEADDGLLAVLGMTVDAATDALWVASAAAPFMVGAKPAEAGRTMISRIDLARGRVAVSYPLPTPGLLNDVALARNGTVYATESRGGAVYRLPRGGSALQTVLAPGSLESPNGIVVLPGGQLLVADFDGLALVHDPDGTAPRVVWLATPDQLYLGGIDGLARARDGVVAIQNLVGRTRVWKLVIDVAGGRVARATVLMRGHPDFLNPTTGVVVGDRLLFVADTKLQGAQPDGTLTALPAGRSGHRLLELSVAPAR